MTEMTWEEHQAWERGWWGDCVHTFSEESKQISYAYRMGLENIGPDKDEKWPLYDLGGKSVVDIGGGPVSMLLKCRNLSRAVVVDPGDYPTWVLARYEAAGIEYVREPAEHYLQRGVETFDEAWLYNVLQHTQDPEAIVAGARKVARVVRAIEPIEVGVCPGHPHNLTAAELDAWYGGPFAGHFDPALVSQQGTVEQMHGENGLHYLLWYGTFAGTEAG